MSGSPFDTLNREIVNASDRTRRLADSTRWKTMQINMAKGFGPNPKKKNGYHYQSDFFVDTKGNPGIDQSGCVVAARNYELFQSISRGKFYTNPSLDGAAAGKYDLWFANCLSIEYQTGCDGDGTCDGVYFAPIIMTNLYTSVDVSNTPYFNDGNSKKIGYDMIPFPSTCLDDCSYNGLVPGFIEDPSFILFTRKCIGSLAAVSRPVDTNLSQAEGWLRNLANIRFKNTPYYWKGALAQPLNKYSYPGRVPLWYQAPSEQSEFIPKTLFFGNNKPKPVLKAFCNGCSGFN